MIRYITVDRLELILKTANPKILDVSNLTWEEVKEKKFVTRLYAKVNIPGSVYTYYVDVDGGDKLTAFRELISDMKEDT